MELFVHSPGAEHPEIIKVEETDLVRVLLVESGEGHVWLEESEEEVDLALSFSAAGIHQRHHVHRGRCPRVEVSLRWGGDTQQHKFAPATTIATIEKWAFEKVAHFSAEQAVLHVLAEPNADHFLEGSVHVGSLTQPGSCTVTLDLLPRSRFEG